MRALHRHFHKPLGRLGWLVGPMTSLIALAVILGAATNARGQASGPFGWVAPTSAPANWHRVPTPAGSATLSYPPVFHAVTSDSGAISAAVGTGPRYEAYLNVTPRQGNERLEGFARFRVNLLGADHGKNVRLRAAAEGLRFHGGQGSAVLDDYSTRLGNHHYTEIAAFVVGRRGGWVIVGASLTSNFTRFQPLLRRAFTSFVVS
jgi:hypothetical protein